ncbi:hypothetical protein ACNF40_01060 [Cuniculiplasma sp. SKW4]|uniref:hypothetical protein n=1 Tax=Cuniculiplasma sp. SKW4 TaxID=3400171 RepID=UPI003FCF0248
MLWLSFSYIVNYNNQSDVRTETYNYLGEKVRFTGNVVTLSFGSLNFPLSWNIYEIRANGGGAKAIPYLSGNSGNFLDHVGFNRYSSRRIYNPIENAAVLT